MAQDVQPLTPAEVLARLSAAGVAVELGRTGECLEFDADCEPAPEIVALIDAFEADLLNFIRMQRAMINRWIAARIIDWPLEHCLGCRNRVLVGQTFIDVTNGSARARFHTKCHPVWLAEQEALARKTIGFGP
jgi:hypothetical protein